MKGARDSALLVGAVLVGLVLAAIVYFLGVSPKLASAQQAKVDTQAQETANGDLEADLVELQKLEEMVPAYTRELYSIREILPPAEDVPSMRRFINDVMVTNGYVVESDSFSIPTAITGGLSLQAQMEQVGLTSEIEGMLFTTLQAVPFSIEVAGPSGGFGSVFQDLVSGDRYVYITSFTVTADDSQDGAATRATIGGFIFTLDSGVAGITKKPDERPWPGTEDEIDLSDGDPFGSIAPPAQG